MKSATACSLCLCIIVAATYAFAHEAEQTEASDFIEYGEQLAFGRAGKAAEVKRKVLMEMNDQFAFVPSQLTVNAGETVRLIFHNTGALVHEWILGTPHEIEEHAKLMRRFPNMEHDEPHQVHVSPGEQRELVWQFNHSGRFEFACLQPGHYEAGMKGLVEVK